MLSFFVVGHLKKKQAIHICYRGTSGTGSCFSLLVGCLHFDSDGNLSHSTDDHHDIDTDSSLESFISLGNLCKLTPPA